jgi:hypothetical protein
VVCISFVCRQAQSGALQKYGKQLRGEQLRNPTWSRHYLNYKLLKGHIKNAQTGDQADPLFFAALKTQILSISAFFDEEDESLAVRLDHVHRTMDHVQKMGQANRTGSVLPLERSLTVLGSDVVALQNFCIVNSEGIRKILKKFEKMTRRPVPMQWKACMQQLPFRNPVQLDDLMAAIEEALETCKDMAVRGSPVGSPLSDTENLRCAVTRDDFEVLKRNLIGIGQSEQLFLLAAQQGKARSVAYFLDSGVNMNERDVNGSTALILASGAGHAELVRILLVRGVDVLLADANSRTCLHVAAALGHQVHVFRRIPAAVCCVCSTAVWFAGCAVDNP